MKRVGIIGSGIVAQTLGSGFLKHGFEVMISSRDLSKIEKWQEENSNSKIGSFNEAAAYGEILVLATKGLAAKESLHLADANNLTGKTIIDATNPIANAAPENGVIKFFTTLEDSLLEHLQNEFPDANFVKAFNSIGSAFMVNPDFGAEKPSMFICGNNIAAKNEVVDILQLFGWETVDMGKVESARAIEPLCMLWCIPGILRNEWSHAFRLLKK